MLINLNAMPGLPGPGSAAPSFGDFPKSADSGEVPGAQQFEQNFDDFGGAQSAPGVGDDFAKMLSSAIDQVDEQDQQARTTALDFALGKNVDPHTVMIAEAKASTMLHLASGVATRAAQDFQTLMNMQI
ncbi:MAG: flagellar hook-basal body complex protein FliE [Cyanobacteria bacterium REEB65]|nr:flagellar hook-basal body complex protein FliE [Cyanobacteria bacterium REEB65]